MTRLHLGKQGAAENQQERGGHNEHGRYESELCRVGDGNGGEVCLGRWVVST